MTSRVAELREYLDRELAIERDADGPDHHGPSRRSADQAHDRLPDRRARADGRWWSPGAPEAERILRILHDTERTT